MTQENSVESVEKADRQQEVQEFIERVHQLEPKVVEYVTDPLYDEEDVIDPYPRTGGCLMARLNPDDPKNIQVGYSFRHATLDHYDKDYGFDKAFSRMDYLQNSSYKKRRIHPRFRPILMMFLIRCKTYFKDCDLPLWAKQFLNDDEELDRTQKYLTCFGTDYQKKKFFELLK